MHTSEDTIGNSNNLLRVRAMDEAIARQGFRFVLATMQGLLLLTFGRDMKYRCHGPALLCLKRGFCLTARRLSRTQRGRVSAPASVGSNRWLGRRERSEPGLPAGAARRAVKPSAKRSA